MGELEMNESERTILLSSHQFEIVFQIAHQLPNFEESRLRSVGCTSEDVVQLTAALRSMRGRVGDSSRIRIDLVDGPLESATGLGETRGNEIRGRLPLALALRWNLLAELVITALGSRELFLRTGYDMDEIRDAVSAFGATQ